MMTQPKTTVENWLFTFDKVLFAQHILKYAHQGKLAIFAIQSLHAICKLCFKRRVMLLRHGLCSKKTDYVRATWLMLRFGRRKSITQSFGA